MVKFFMHTLIAIVVLSIIYMILNFLWIDEYAVGDVINVRKYELQSSQRKLWVGDEVDIIVRKDAIFLYTQKGRQFSLINYLKDDFDDF